MTAPRATRAARQLGRRRPDPRSSIEDFRKDEEAGRPILSGALRPEAALRLTLLGGFQARLQAGAVLSLPTRKTQALLAYLALPLGQTHSRDKLAGLLWSDMPDAQARGNLRHALSRIGKALPGAVRAGLILDGPSVALDPAIVDVDVARFERLAAEGGIPALEQVPGLYRGELLAGLALAERPFDEWLTAERERLHKLAIQGLGHLLSHQQQAGAAEAAVQTGLRLLALDSLQEPVHRAVMRLYARLGRREAALRQYQVCVDALRRELGAPPEAETTQLYRETLRSRAIRPERAATSSPAREALRSVAQPARPEGAAPTNLTAAASNLIGRAGSLAEVTDLLAVHRLVTLIGAGGIGKTRLGLEVARGQLAGHADGVWVIELAPLSDPALVPVAVAMALGLTLPAGAESSEQLASALGAKRLLLVLDNCEHVIEAAARLAGALLRANSHVRVLATSREPLRAAGEHVYRVPPLAVPMEGIEDREDLLETAAVRLFVARAEAIDSRFSLDARRAVIAGAVCRRLDGIPLAIELAAARTATLGVEALAAHLDDRFHLLTTGHRTALPRHQTLRATLDWSYDLLPEIERTVLHRLAIFAGGFTLEAAGAVAVGRTLDESEVVDGVTNLAAKSLVSVDLDGTTIRYRLPETMRAYALEKLTGSGELDQVARRHAEYYRDLFEGAEVELETRAIVEWLAAYGRQLDNVRAALDWAFSPGGDAAIGVTLTVATVPLWMHLTLMSECCARVERAIASLGPRVLPDARRDMRVFLALGTALLHTSRVGSPEMTTALTKALALAESLDDTEYRLRALYELYLYRLITSDYRGALARAEEFVTVAAGTADPTDPLIGARLVGTILHILGDQAGAWRHVEPLARADFARRAPIAHRALPVRSARRRAVLPRAHPLAPGIPRSGHAGDRDHRRLRARGGPSHLVALRAGPGRVSDRARGREPRGRGSLREADRRALGQARAGDMEACGPGASKACCSSSAGRASPERAVLRAAHAELPEAAFHLHNTPFLAELAEGLGGAGHIADGLVVIDDALARAERTEERWILAELLRKKGELLRLGGAPNAATRSRGALRAGARLGPTPGRALVGAAQRHEPGASLAPTGSHPPRARAPGPDLRPVHGRLRHRRSPGREDTARHPRLAEAGHGFNASRIASLACRMAARVPGTSWMALSRTKSWIIPLYRVAVTATPASLSLRAYASPSSRSGSFSAVMISAGGRPRS